MNHIYFFLLLAFPHPSSTTSSRNNSDVSNQNHFLDGNCRLYMPSSIMNNSWEAHGTPLSIYMLMRVMSVRDVPDSGGSFGVDIL